MAAVRAGSVQGCANLGEIEFATAGHSEKVSITDRDFE